ncbi:MAG TPA: choice-of-anchor D domain-containing protein, partial [Candidatus Acidoferrum sp.]|nr:choice-of-anchor D domain-containing protein [Candidatus Acidoferrum sp.]
FSIQGTGVAAPEIAVFTGATTNAGSARTDNVGTNAFANTAVGSSSAAQTFTVKNIGTANLTGLVLTKAGANASEFILGSLGATTLAPQATTAFTVTFSPTTAGTRSAVVNIASNDGDENPFSINVSGVGLATEASALVEASIPGDTIAATSANSPAGQGVANAIDNTVTNKYLNLDKLNTGMTITPVGNRPVQALTLISAEDAPERDPSSFVIEGSDNGVNFTRIASNAVPAFSTRHFVHSIAFSNTNVFNHYRMLFPTVSNAVTANSMQIAEVELLYHGEITSPNDIVSITLPPGAVDVRGVGSLFDRQLDGVRKLEVAPIPAGSNTIVNIIPAVGSSVLKGFELIGAADDFSFPQRRPSSVVVAGSNDGINYTNLATFIPAAPSANLQIQEFSTSSNNTAFARYRITFGPPVSGDRIQVGEMRLFGEVPPGALPPLLWMRAISSNVLVSWTNRAGFVLETKTNFNTTNWTSVGNAPVLSNGVNTVTLPRSGDAGFFRLQN